jgi:Arc/MetJ family transcription regulator
VSEVPKIIVWDGGSWSPHEVVTPERAAPKGRTCGEIYLTVYIQWDRYGGVSLMSKTVIDLDEDLVQRAADALGTTSKKATVDQALRRVVMEQMRSRHVERFRSGDNHDLNDQALMDAAWQGSKAAT